jgi:pimeloyl-ACP methyl ester carboxylesterase
VDFVVVAHSPLAPDAAPVRIAYRNTAPSAARSDRTDETPAIVFLHGGWGYEMYPFDRQITAFGVSRRIVIPDRSGYGASPAIATLPSDFHQRAADETIAVLDTLGLARPVLWGHSDGAIIALRIALASPDRVAGVIAEATHFFRRKAASTMFFENVIANPASTAIMRAHAQAWLTIGAEAASPTDDFYRGRLGTLTTPTLLVHGGRDPRTEPGEIDALHRAAPLIQVRVFADAGHSPHSEIGSAEAVTAAAARFLGAA